MVSRNPHIFLARICAPKLLGWRLSLVRVLRFNVLICENSDDEKTHSQKFMPIIDDVFKKTNL